MFETQFILLVDLQVCAILLFIDFFFFISFFSVIVVHLDDLSCTRGYDIRQYNGISHCDYFRLQE